MSENARLAEPDRSGEPDEQATSIVLESFLTYQISILAKLVDRRSIRVLAQKYGLKLAEWRVLAQLANRSPSTVRYLARRMRMDRADVSRAAAALIARGLVTREADEADARSALFSVTKAGLGLYDGVLPSRVAENARLGAIFAPDELAAFNRALALLTAELSAEADS